MAVAEVTFEDEFADGAVLVIEKKFRSGNTLYSYAAIKAGGFWYVTGRGISSGRGLSTRAFIEFLLAGWDHEHPPRIFWAPKVFELAFKS